MFHLHVAFFRHEFCPSTPCWDIFHFHVAFSRHEVGPTTPFLRYVSFLCRFFPPQIRSEHTVTGRHKLFIYICISISIGLGYLAWDMGPCGPMGHMGPGAHGGACLTGAGGAPPGPHVPRVPYHIPGKVSHAYIS